LTAADRRLPPLAAELIPVILASAAAAALVTAEASDFRR
jgi:hypothetical protein